MDIVNVVTMAAGLTVGQPALPVRVPDAGARGGVVLQVEQLDAVRAGGFWSIYPNVEIGYFTLFGKSYPYYKPFKPVL